MKIIEDSMKALEKALNISQVRNRVITENIANSETPGFKGKKVDFQEAMKKADNPQGLTLSRTKKNHIAPKGLEQSAKIEKTDAPEKADGNNVDQNIEMAKLSENTIIYNTSAEILSRKIKLIRFAIEDGGK